MKAPDRNCMFCHQVMEYAELWEPPDMGGFGYAGEPYYIYMCTPCHCQQDVEIATSQIKRYSFKINRYHLAFNVKYHSFQIGLDPPEEPNNTETILSLNILPTHLTPQNVTEERIHLFLLFS